MNKQTILIIITTILLAGICLFLGAEYFIVQQKLETVQKNLKIQQFNEKVINFNKLFIEKVLKTENDVSLEDRLKLENAVRDLKDQEILDQWQKFTDCATEQQAQEEVKNLLDLLLKKIIY